MANVADDNTLWAFAKDVKPGDVLTHGAKVLAVTIVANSFVKITYEWGSAGQSMYPGLKQRIPLRSVEVH